MPLPVRFLLGSPRRLFGAVVLFIVLDLSVLLLNLWIARAVAADAVAINLAGRQRMLSQRITKSAMLASGLLPGVDRTASLHELTGAYRLFSGTLQAFDQGGATTGGDGRPVVLDRVESPAGRSAVQQVNRLLLPIQPSLASLEQGGTLAEPQLLVVRDYMVRHNTEMLEWMNRLTSALEQESVHRTSVLRFAQTSAFVLALFNFLLIVLGLVRRQHQAEQEGQQWRQAAQRDALTGLFNRMAFDRRLEQALAQARLSGDKVALLMIDLDGFKPVNDRHGHAMGDAVLRSIAQALQSVARDTDTVARLGGDEFALFCPHLHSASALQDLCQRLLQRLDQVAVRLAPITVRASLGVAVFPQDGADAPALMHAADTAMYQSKQNGGHCATLVSDLATARRSGAVAGVNWPA
ncbi:MAG TPA: diguanylate cyclase [Macromonas sp.]|nr:diguanylate cyclase [Macromonas sp.]